jgi:hypothetical protein
MTIVGIEKKYDMFRKIGLLCGVVGGLILCALPACDHDMILVDPNPIDTMHVDTMPSDTLRFCDPDTIYFEKDVLPIVLSSCGMALCHDAVTKKAGYQYTSYETIMATGRVVPFDLQASEFYQKMIVTVIIDDTDVMPPSPRGPISDTNISVIRRWIEQGAQDLVCMEDTVCTVPAPVSFAQDVFPVINKYCKGCHSGTHPWGDRYLRNYSDIKPIATPNGLLLSVINHEDGFPQMPNTLGKLDSCIIATITQWVNDGASNN